MDRDRNRLGSVVQNRKQRVLSDPGPDKLASLLNTVIKWLKRILWYLC